jgi:hypothetical protein
MIIYLCLAVLRVKSRALCIYASALPLSYIPQPSYYYYFFFAVLGLELRAYTLSHFTSFVKGFFPNRVS